MYFCVYRLRRQPRTLGSGESELMTYWVRPGYGRAASVLQNTNGPIKETAAEIELRIEK